MTPEVLLTVNAKYTVIRRSSRDKALRRRTLVTLLVGKKREVSAHDRGCHGHYIVVHVPVVPAGAASRVKTYGESCADPRQLILWRVDADAWSSTA